jgi:glutaredoxin
VTIQIYRWGGQWGPFKVKIPCGECALTKDIVTDTLKHELDGLPVAVKIDDWLSNWWKPLFKGGWHAPIVMVDGAIVSQGQALNRGVFTEAVIRAHAEKTSISGTHVFGKDGCPHCQRAKGMLEARGIDYHYHDVVAEPAALYEMLARVKPIVGPKTPITVPQIWIDGAYVGGADALCEHLGEGGLRPDDVRDTPDVSFGSPRSKLGAPSARLPV